MSNESKQLLDRYMAAYFIVTKRLNGEISTVIQDDLTPDQFQIIDYIATHPRCISTELAEAFAVGKSSITAIITRLADREILERTRDDADRRVIYLSLTEYGKSLYDKTREQIQNTISTYLVHFDKQEVEGFLSAFEKLAELMKEGSQEDL